VTNSTTKTHTTGVYADTTGKILLRSCLQLRSTDGSWRGAIHCTNGV
jgi:hypothetical protein